ncbi:BCSC C-terminal domain-containing protein [Cyanobacterium stanieri LEGE 03274]|uniref:BCSC C-terminal domain-containing protein n=1 Tax=Cyanobacterium stanieri LEGE 03274 TaxID=1828756 RepID=A0ABR9V3P6_9CHRO|nr:cellulose synthase subunit BcsC-related outer membrane protein [Cyanobacterium stanieri]MBE9222523.1 BCSC C-terminal domain-containing protein [Cyanobacterium stanieri LEGE 03274]
MHKKKYNTKLFILFLSFLLGDFFLVTRIITANDNNYNNTSENLNQDYLSSNKKLNKQYFISHSSFKIPTKSSVIVNNKIKLYNQIFDKKEYLIASPENFNPSLNDTFINPESRDLQTNEINRFKIESITPSFYLDSDNFGQENIYREILLNFQSPNQNNFNLRTGINSFRKTDIEDINHIPLIFGWQKQLNNTNLNLNVGVDFFDRIRNSPNLSVSVEQPLSINIEEDGALQSLFVAGATVEHQAYKFNATTIENEVTLWRFRPQFYWLIAPDISLFSFAQYGSFSDGNHEFQSFSRLEKTLGEFSLSGNLFIWSFAQNLENSSGYFSPPDFLVYNLELAWKKQFTDSLICRLAASFGQQRLEGEFSDAFVYEGLCQATLFPRTVLDLSYRVSNILTVEGDATSYRNEQLKAQVKYSF